ncbi:hypothetical protein TNCT_61851 [Trichonephila clavata]|uniref:Uncharacterized protein n=1 Tax=Trichonephila clavata TaxID=2740835 RepID=A0A8X6IAV3_TRICU|nr:hypothetical protein TNCT_61851 [Trichonephila clavata]
MTPYRNFLLREVLKSYSTTIRIFPDTALLVVGTLFKSEYIKEIVLCRENSKPIVEGAIVSSVEHERAQLLNNASTCSCLGTDFLDNRQEYCW